MADEALYLDGTLLDRFVAAIGRGDENLAQRLASLAPGPENLDLQRDEAWTLLSAGTLWAAARAELGRGCSDQSAAAPRLRRSLRRARRPSMVSCGNSVSRARRMMLSHSSWRRSSRLATRAPTSARSSAVSSHACGPRPPTGISVGREPNPADLQAIGSELGDALRRLGELRLADPIQEVEGLRLPETA